MAVTFSIAPNPHWVIIDNFSKLPNGAAIYTFRNKNPSEFKPAFQDAGGNVPYGQPIQGFGNGTMPPIFWAFDDADPTETYYIRVYDAPITSNGNFLWDFHGISGGPNGGGGGTIITNNDIENLIINGQFYQNIGDVIGAPSIPTFITLAPSNNAGIGGLENTNSPGSGPPSPDIIFSKTNQTDTDSIQFVPVVLGDNNLGSNPTPEFFVRYSCSVGGAGQAHKYIQFPVIKGLQNLSGATVSVQLFARLVSGSPTGMTLTFRQFFGNGGAPSADVIDVISGGPINLVVGTWKQIILNSHVIPSIAGKAIGSCGNDALFFQMNFPLSDPFTVEFILPSIYLGATTSNFDLHTLDEVEAIVNKPRTGDLRVSINNFSQYGWLAMRDGTIGSTLSGASERGATDTFQLFSLIWNTFKGANEGLAPMSGGAYGADPVADFTANRTLTLTKTAGRVLAAVGVPSANSVPVTGGSNLGIDWAIGQSTGNEQHTQAGNEVGVHNHTAVFDNAIAFVNSNVGAGGTPTYRQDSGTNLGIIVNNNAAPVAFNVQQPVAYCNVFIKL